MIYSLDISILIKRFTPPFLRGTNIHSFGLIITKPLETLYNGFLAFRQRQNALLVINSQQIVLQNELNNRYDSVQRRITIQTNNAISQIAEASLQSEGIILEASLQSEGVIAQAALNIEINDYDFWVNVPTDLLASEQAITRYVERYKLAGKRFELRFL